MTPDARRPEWVVLQDVLDKRGDRTGEQAIAAVWGAKCAAQPAVDSWPEGRRLARLVQTGLDLRTDRFPESDSGDEQFTGWYGDGTHECPPDPIGMLFAPRSTSVGEDGEIETSVDGTWAECCPDLSIDVRWDQWAEATVTCDHGYFVGTGCGCNVVEAVVRAVLKFNAYTHAHRCTAQVRVARGKLRDYFGEERYERELADTALRGHPVEQPLAECGMHHGHPGDCEWLTLDERVKRRKRIDWCSCGRLVRAGETRSGDDGSSGRSNRGHGRELLDVPGSGMKLLALRHTDDGSLSCDTLKRLVSSAAGAAARRGADGG